MGMGMGIGMEIGIGSAPPPVELLGDDRIVAQPGARVRHTVRVPGGGRVCSALLLLQRLGPLHRARTVEHLELGERLRHPPHGAGAC